MRPVLVILRTVRRACVRRSVSWIYATLPVVALFALTAGLPNATSLAQVLPGEIARDHIKRDLDVYHKLVADYRRGTADITDELVEWDAKRIRRLLAAIESVNDETRPWEAVRFKAAAMMHTDAARSLLERGQLQTALVQVDTASQLLMKAGPAVRSYASRWHQATARLLRTRASPAVSEAFLQTARERLPNDSTVLYESAILEELVASDTTIPLVVYLPDLNTPPPNPNSRNVDSMVRVTREDVDDLRRRRRERLNRATTWLRQSVEADPSNLLARLHLGRLHFLRKQNREALELLGRASNSEDPAVAYLALLFTGALHEREGILDAALQAYRAAIERFPLNHAAYIALSALLQRTGNADESRDILTQVVDGRATSRREPWWSYLAEPQTAHVARFDVLRREARQWD